MGSLLVMLMMEAEAGAISDTFEKVKVEAELRAGAVQSQDGVGHKASTLALGGQLGIQTNPIAGVRAGATFYTTNALFGQNEEPMFLSSESKSYSILGEAYIQADIANTTIKAGRQTIETPYAESDDIGMIPDRFEGITVVNQDIADTTIVLASLDKWAGFDSDRAEKFKPLQASGDAVLTAGAIYEGLENSTLQAWHYKLDSANFNYLEAGYETEEFSVALQYTNQDNSNRAYGAIAGVRLGDFALTTAYNRVNGEVSNGFGGGPFFTSSEDHTIAEAVDQEAVLVGAEYRIEDLTLGLTHVVFDKGEDETDFLVSYALSKALSLDVIYSEMYADGKLSRVFANYSF